MKKVTLEEAKERLHDLLQDAGEELIVILDDGKAVGVLCAWPDLDPESLEFATSREFWELIQSRRRSASIPWSQGKKDAGL